MEDATSSYMDVATLSRDSTRILTASRHEMKHPVTQMNVLCVEYVYCRRTIPVVRSAALKGASRRILSGDEVQTQ